MDLLALDAWARQATGLIGMTVRKVSPRDGGIHELSLSGPGLPGFLCWSLAGPDPILCHLTERLPAGEKGKEADPGLRRPLEGAVITGIVSGYPERRLEILLRPAIPKITPGPLRLVLELRPPGGGLLADGDGRVRWRSGEVPAVTVSLPPPPESFPAERIAATLEGRTPAEGTKAATGEIFGLTPWIVREALSAFPREVPLDGDGASRAAEGILSLVAERRSGGGGWEAVPTDPADLDSPWKVVGRPAGERDVNAALARALTAGREAAERRQIRRPLVRILRRTAERDRRTLAAMDREIPSWEEIALQRRRGELLLAHLRLVPAGTAFVDLPSFDDPSRQVTIPLDPSLSPQANAEACFTRARKGERAIREKAARREDLARRVALADTLLDAAASETDLEALRDLAARVGERRATGRRRPERAPALPVRVFPLPGGGTVLVGKNAAGNELIYRHLSRADDLWMHARDWPGSHVLVREAGPEGAAGRAVALAAALAAWYSKGRGAGRVEVAATARRNLRKPPGSAPGTVTLREERSIAVNLSDPEVGRMLRDAGVGDA